MPLLITQICLLVVIVCSIITYRNLYKTIQAVMASIDLAAKNVNFAIQLLNDHIYNHAAVTLPTINPRPDWPTNCFSCGAFLRGGATQHKDGCVIKSLIDQHFPKTN